MSKNKQSDGSSAQNIAEQERLLKLKQMVKEKTEIDMDVLMDPDNPNFEQYALEDPTKENLVETIRLNMWSRNIKIGAAFAIYHLVKTPLWHYGYGAHFFYRTRFLTIPIVAGALFYSTTSMYVKELTGARVFSYQLKRSRYDMHKTKTKKLLEVRASYFSEVENERESATNINTLINIK